MTNPNASTLVLETTVAVDGSVTVDAAILDGRKLAIVTEGMKEYARRHTTLGAGSKQSHVLGPIE